MFYTVLAIMVYVGNMLEGNYLYKIIPVKTVRKLVHFGILDISIGRHPMYTLLWSKIMITN